MNKTSKLKLSKNLQDMRDDSEIYFMSAGDIETKMPQTFKEEPHNETNFKNIQDFLLKVTSGQSYRNDPNYLAVGGGRIITTISKVKKMFDEGYNIISSSLIGNVNGDILVEIEYEKLMKRNNSKIR